MLSAADVAARCDKARQRPDGGWQACCPAHDDDSPSLSITDGTDKTLVHCHAGCTTDAIMAALGLSMTDLFPPRASLHINSRTPSAPRPRVVAEYEYTDAHGTVLYQVRRWEPGRKGGTKDFSQRRPDGQGGWIDNMESVTHQLWRLPEVLAAVAAGEVLYVAEGEKACQALLRLGICATTKSGGAKTAWEPHYSEALRGAYVVILPDNDAPGNACAQKTAQALHGIAADVKVIGLPGLPEHGDVVEWLVAGGDRPQLEALVEAAPLWDASAQSGAFGSFGSASPWAFPEKLSSGFPDVPALTPELLPVALRAWLTDIAERQQVPLEFVAAPALIALATVIGRKVTIRPKQRDDWLVVPNLWGAIVGRPGVLKSPAMKAALAPLDRLVATAADRYQQELVRGQAELAAHEARLKAIKHAMEVVAKKPSLGGKTLDDLTQELIDLQAQAPVLFCERRYRTNDSTIEKLGELFQENPTGLMLFRDELSGWLRSLDKSGREGDREFFLEAWNGDGAFTVDRIGRGTKHIPALCLSLCGGIQPGKLTAYIEDAVAGGYGDDGLIQRFQLLLWPDIPTTWANVDRYPDITAKNSAYAVYQRLDEAAASWFGCHQDSDSALPHLAFASDAQELFDTWRAELEAALRNGSLTCPALESHLAKYRSLMPSLALLFHLVDVATQQTAQPAVSLNAARMAATWCDFLRPHAERVYATVMTQDLHAAHALADHLKRGDIHDGDSVRSIYRRQWSSLNTPERVGDALTVLERHHWLRVEEQPTNGRATEVIVLNPALGQIL